MNPTRIFFIGLLLFPSLIPAAVDLFSATVPLAEDTSEARQRAMGAALHAVLVKSSGRQVSARRPEVGTMLKRAESHVQEFRYLNAPSDQEEGEPRKMLWVRFDRRAVGRLLRELGLSPWEGGRPELLLWLAVDEQGRRRLADPELDRDLLEAASSAARARGFTLLRPLMDLQDRNALGPADLWVGDRQGIRDASARYGRPVPLVGRLSGWNEQFEIKWLLLFPDRAESYRSTGGTPGAALASGIEQAAEILARRYLPATERGASELVRVRFLDVQGLDQYARLWNLLRSLDSVSSPKLIEAEADRLEFELKAAGGGEVLSKQFSLHADLSPVVDVPEEDEEDSPVETLSYSVR